MPLRMSRKSLAIVVPALPTPTPTTANEGRSTTLGIFALTEPEATAVELTPLKRLHATVPEVVMEN
jgi:hypothetical protein